MSNITKRPRGILTNRHVAILHQDFAERLDRLFRPDLSERFTGMQPQYPFFVAQRGEQGPQRRTPDAGEGVRRIHSHRFHRIHQQRDERTDGPFITERA